MQGIVYMLRSPSTGMVYYGSTNDTIEMRLRGHSANYKSYKKGLMKYMMTAFKVLECGDAEILTIEKVAGDLPTLREREAYYIKNMPCVNKYVPNRSQKQYYEDNKAKRLEQMKAYYNAHKQEINEKRKQPKNCDLCKCNVTNSTQHRRSKKHQAALTELDSAQTLLLLE
jgi:hypothetical protein